MTHERESAGPAAEAALQGALTDLGLGHLQLDAERRQGLRWALCGWFAAHARDLPWRRVGDPYAIWISEAMLQQTQVATVVPYWERFLERFPDVEALALAEEDDLLAAWSGLGYYRRARSLQAAARVIVAQHHGSFPRRRPDAESLPGVGPYTAGAVLSIAYGLPEAVVDGNVARVFARLFGLEDPLASTRLDKRLWALARALVPPAGSGPDGPGAWNQGLMELGATLCTPKSPGCLLCPLAEACVARRDGRQAELPVPKPKPEKKQVELLSLLVWQRGRVLLERRPLEGRMAGMWELPTRELTEHGLWPEGWIDPELEPGEVLGSVSHGITVHRIRCEVRRGAFHAAGGRLDPGGPLAWHATERLPELGLTGMTKKVLAKDFARRLIAGA
jgi:A/G-specific adenine glycosylase